MLNGKILNISVSVCVCSKSGNDRWHLGQVYFGTDVTECRARCSSRALRASSSPTGSRVVVEVAPVSCRGNRHSPGGKTGTTRGSCCLSKHFITFTNHIASLWWWWCLTHLPTIFFCSFVHNTKHWRSSSWFLSCVWFILCFSTRSY